MKKIIFGLLCLCSFIGFSFAAKLSFSYPQNHLVADCPSKVDVILDTEGQMTTAMDLRILWDQNVMNRDYFDIDGSVFKTSTLPYFSSSNGMNTSYILLSTLSRWGFSGVGRIGTITLTPTMNRDTPYLHLKFSMIPNKDREDSNVIVISDGKAFDTLNKTSDLFLPIRTGMCDEQVQAQLEAQKLALQKQISNQSSAAVVLIENNSYSSQHSFQEKIDSIKIRFIHNIFGIIVVFLTLSLASLAWYLVQIKKMSSRVSHTKK